MCSAVAPSRDRNGLPINTPASAASSPPPGHGEPPDGEQFLHVKLQSDAEHQQDHANFRPLLGHKAGRVRAEQRAAQ